MRVTAKGGKLRIETVADNSDRMLATTVTHMFRLLPRAALRAKKVPSLDCAPEPRAWVAPVPSFAPFRGRSLSSSEAIGCLR